MNDLIRGIHVYLNRVSEYDLGVVAVQLLLIGLVVWWVMRFLRGTRGARLLNGAAVLLVVGYMGISLIPQNPEWKRLEYLYGRFLLVTLAAVVIAFQPELRRALISIGQARVFRGIRSDVEAMVDSIVDSAAWLARNRTGALVAIERSVGLGALVQTGTHIQASLSSSLLNTIFYPGTALHDMGVIVRNGQLLAAGCQFPLAESDDVDRSLGSRHRAALGLVQETDAVVVVVSEETGRISLAYDGQLHIGMELENLRETLLGLLAPHRPNTRRRQNRRAKAA